MAYNSNIPKPTDKIEDSQNDILDNFGAIKVAFDQNHVALDGSGSGNEGKHKFVQFPDQAGDVASAATDVNLWAKNSTKTGETELFYRKQNNGTIRNVTASSLGVNNGWAFLPNGLLMKWGSRGPFASLGGGSGVSNIIIYPTTATDTAFTTILHVSHTVRVTTSGDIDKLNILSLIISNVATNFVVKVINQSVIFSTEEYFIDFCTIGIPA